VPEFLINKGIFNLLIAIIYVLASNEFRQHEILTWGKIPNPLFEKERRIKWRQQNYEK